MPQLQKHLLPSISITCVKTRCKLTLGGGFLFNVAFSPCVLSLACWILVVRDQVILSAYKG